VVFVIAGQQEKYSSSGQWMFRTYDWK